MTIIKKPENREFILDLTGPQGNAFVLLGVAQDLCKQLGWDKKKILDEMRAKDYEHLVKTFDKYFGRWVTLWI